MDLAHHSSVIVLICVHVAFFILVYSVHLFEIKYSANKAPSSIYLCCCDHCISEKKKKQVNYRSVFIFQQSKPFMQNECSRKELYFSLCNKKCVSVMA